MSMFPDLEDGEAEAEGEGYDHLDFRRPVNELKPQYLSTESIKTERSRNTSGRSRQGGNIYWGNILCNDIKYFSEATRAAPGRARTTCWVWPPPRRWPSSASAPAAAATSTGQTRCSAASRGSTRARPRPGPGRRSTSQTTLKSSN